MEKDEDTPGICGACDKPQHRNLAKWIGNCSFRDGDDHGFAIGNYAKYANTKLCINHALMLRSPRRVDQLVHDIEAKLKRQNGTIRIGA